MDVLVVGRSGQLASALLAHNSESLAVTALGRDRLDMTAPDRIAEIVKRVRPDGVINASAYNFVDAAENDPGPAFAINRDGPTALAHACANLNIPLVHVSTDYVFGDAKRTPYLETDPPAPMNVYGQSKWEGEQGVLAAGGVASVVRTCWVYSPGEGNFVTMMLGLAGQGRDVVRVVEDQVGRPTYAKDLAGASLAILKGLRAGNTRYEGLIHYCGDEDVDRATFAEAIFDGARRRGLPSAEVVRITANEFAAPAPRPSYSALDTAHARSLPGLQVPTWRSQLEVCLDRIVER